MAGLLHPWRVLHDLPLHALPPAVRVQRRASWARGAGPVQHVRGVTDLRGSTRQASRRRRGGRDQGKLAQAPFHPCTPHGDPLVAHHDGHGTQHLSDVLATVLLGGAGRSDPAVVVGLLPRGLGDAGELTPEVGTPAGVGLCRGPGVHAPPVCCPGVWDAEDPTSLWVGLFRMTIASSRARMRSPPTIGPREGKGPPV